MKTIETLWTMTSGCGAGQYEFGADLRDPPRCYECGDQDCGRTIVVARWSPGHSIYYLICVEGEARYAVFRTVELAVDEYRSAYHDGSTLEECIWRANDRLFSVAVKRMKMMDMPAVRGQL